MIGVWHHPWSLVPATWTVQLCVPANPPQCPQMSPRHLCGLCLSHRPLDCSALAWVALVMQISLDKHRCFSLALKLFSSSSLPLLLFSVSHIPKLPSTQVLASPVPLQSRVCSSHALLGTFLSLPALPHEQRLPSIYPLFVLRPLSALLSYGAPSI